MSVCQPLAIWGETESRSTDLPPLGVELCADKAMLTRKYFNTPNLRMSWLSPAYLKLAQNTYISLQLCKVIQHKDCFIIRC